jgi:hypothetical protein
MVWFLMSIVVVCVTGILQKWLDGSFDGWADRQSCHYPISLPPENSVQVVTKSRLLYLEVETQELTDDFFDTFGPTNVINLVDVDLKPFYYYEQYK